jgi:major membrane immunogen (membrane-anchored lipoprotein)
MKKIFAVTSSFVLAAGLLAGCGGGSTAGTPADNATQGSPAPAEEQAPAQEPAPVETVAEAKWADGVYFAQQDSFNEKNGLKYFVALKVEGGNITDVQWNATLKDGGMDKVSLSKAGKYPMVANGGAQADWHVQAEKAEQFLIEKQDPKAITYTDEEGHTDAISGVSVHVNELFDLAQQALDAGAVEAGAYKDGTYHAEQADFDPESGYKSIVDLTVVNGKIIAVDWNALDKDGKDKDTLSKNGEYGMKEKAGAQAEWHEQAQKAEQFLIEKQDVAAITLSDAEGHTDAISGVSVHVSDFVQLVTEALAQAK